MTYSRKEFLGLGAVLAGALGLRRTPAGSLGGSASPVPAPLPPLQARGAGIEADLIVVNGRVLTQDDAAPRAEAFAVKDERFLAVGGSASSRWPRRCGSPAR